MEKVVTLSDHTREPEMLASSVKVTQEVPRSRRRSGHVHSKLYKKMMILHQRFICWRPPLFTVGETAQPG